MIHIVHNKVYTILYYIYLFGDIVSSNLPIKNVPTGVDL